MNLPLESWHNHYAAIQAIDQAVRLFLGFLGARNTMVLLVPAANMFACCFRLIFRLFINILTTNLCNICKKQSSTNWLLQGEHFCPCSFYHMSANLQYKELISFLHYFGSFQEGVHQEQNYLSRPTKINGITLVLHLNCFLGCRWLV